MDTKDLKDKYDYFIENLQATYNIANDLLISIDNKLQEKELTNEEFILLDKNFFYIGDLVHEINIFFKTSENIKFEKINLDNYKNLVLFNTKQKDIYDFYCESDYHIDWQKIKSQQYHNEKTKNIVQLFPNIQEDT